MHAAILRPPCRRNQGYGHVIVDECHHLGTAAYEHSVKRIAVQFWLGLTATPTRRDGLGQLVTWQGGPVRHTLTDEEQGTLAAAMHTDAEPQRSAVHPTRPPSSPATSTLTRPAR